MDTYASKYQHLAGIFFDEASESATDLPYYAELYKHVLAIQGFSHVILNPGTQPDAGYLNVSNNKELKNKKEKRKGKEKKEIWRYYDKYIKVSTSIVIFENSGAEISQTTFASWVTCAPNTADKPTYKYRFAGIGHDTSASNSGAYITDFQNKGFGLVYVTGNPFSSFSIKSKKWNIYKIKRKEGKKTNAIVDGAGGCCTYNNLVSYFASEISTVQSMNNWFNSLQINPFNNMRRNE